MARQAYNDANTLFVDEDYEEALKLYTKAIALDDGNTAEFYIKRSACQEKLKKYTDSVADATTAIKLDPSNHNAYLRKGIACFHLEEYETAKKAFQDGITKEGAKDTVFKTWIRKCEAELLEEEEAEAKEVEEKVEELKPVIEEIKVEKNQDNNNKSEEQEIKAQPIEETKPEQIHESKVESKVRHSWYQNADWVTIEFFVKSLTPKDVDVEFQDNSIEVSIRLQANVDWVYDKVLCGKIVPKESKFSILSTKLEVKLKKEKSGIQWASLEKLGDDKITIAPDQVKHVYPSSKGVKNWDKIAAEIPDEKLEGEQALNKVFQQIFAGGSDEQRKAMIKSFTESSGTVLSTNWDEVGKGTVKGSPPKGMEMHSWDELSKGSK